MARLLRAMFIRPHKQYSIRQLSLLIKCSYGQTYDEVQALAKMNILKKIENKIILNRDHLDYQELHKIFSYDKILVSNRLLNDMELIKTELIKHKFVTILAHHNADPDSLGSAIALAQGLRQINIASEVVAPGGISKQTRGLLEVHKYQVLDTPKQKSELFFTLDASSREQLGDFDIRGKKFILIDHHEKGDLLSMAFLPLLDTGSSSTALLTLKFLQFLDVKLTEEIKFYLAAGMITDTAFLRRMNEEDLKALEHAIGDKSIEEIVSILSTDEDISERIAKMKAYRRVETWQIDRKLVSFSYVGSFESSVALSLVKSGSDAAFVFNTSENELRVSGRCRPSFGINLADLLKNADSLINGHAGGHSTAASANGKNVHAKEPVKKLLLNEIKSILKADAKPINF